MKHFALMSRYRDSFSGPFSYGFNFTYFQRAITRFNMANGGRRVQRNYILLFELKKITFFLKTDEFFTNFLVSRCQRAIDRE